MDRAAMDRKAIAKFRAEEKELCDKVHKKLEKLMLIYPESLEFRKIFVEGMFLKPNQKGLFHVMHYLFTILDPAEFKKRFYWPIHEKNAERVFRTSIVEYLIYLNKKHNLQWKHQWTYLVQMPGGKRFLTFLDDFIDFVANEIIKEKEKHIDLKEFKLDEPLTSSLIVKLKHQNQCYKENMLNFVEDLDVHTKKLKQKIEIMKERLSKISKETGIDVEKLTDEKFCNEFSKFSDDIIVNANFSKHIEKIKETTESVKIIKNGTIKFNNDKEALMMDAAKWKNIAEKFLPNENNVSNKNEIDFTKLFEMFIKACPIVDEYLLSFEKNKIEVLQHQENELSNKNSKVLEYEQDIKQLLDSLNQELDDVKEKEVKLSDIDPKLFSKFISTPPIVNLKGENNCLKDIVRKRLPLMENNEKNEAPTSPSHDEFSFTNQPIVLFPSSAKKQFKKIEIESASKILDRQPRKSSVDPTAFLKSLREMRTPRRFANKNCNEIELKQETEIALTATLTSENIDINNDQKENKISEITSKTEYLKIFDSPLILTTPEKLPESKKKIYLDSHEMHQIVKGSQNFIKHDIDVDLERFSSSSPSGRLEPLVRFNSRKSLDRPGISALDLSPQYSGGKVEPRKLFDVSNTDEIISEISDSILKDVPM